MSTKQILLAAGMILLLNGCTMIPRYTRPSMPVPATFPGIEASADKPASELKWQEIFPDEKLQKVITMALENNRDLRIALLNVDRARALYGVSRAQLFPSLDGSFARSKQRIPADLSATKKAYHPEQFNVDLGITAWEIDLFGRIRSLKQQALEEYLGSEQARRGARTSLISEAALAYLTLAADLEKLKLAQVTLETQRSVYGVLWQQYDKGIIGEADLRRAQTQVDAARLDIGTYTRLVGEDRNALDLLAGSPVPEELIPNDLSTVIPLSDITPSLSSDVLLRRPDIMAAEHQLKAAHATIGAARAAFFPRISLTSVIGSASNELSRLLGPSAKAWTFAQEAVMPIFDSRTFAAFRVSKATREISLAQYEKAIQTAFREVADVLAACGVIEQQLLAQEAIVDSSRKICDISTQRYLHGIDGYLSVLDAQRSLYASQQGLTSVRLAKQANQARLYAVLGGDSEP